MTKLAHLLLFAAAVIVGWFARDRFEPVSDPLELEIAKNHERCDEDKPQGYTAYPVTFYGDLRGCYVVRVDGPEWMPKHAMFKRVK